MRIRDEQMDAFREAMLVDFRRRMLVHLRSVCKAENRVIADLVLQETVEIGMRKADLYGFTDEKDVERYLTFMVRYSRDFDTNPRTAWAGEILRDPDVPDWERMNALEFRDMIEPRRTNE